MASKKEGKTREQVAQEARDKEMLVGKIRQMTARVPQKVVNGSYQAAVAWKECARKSLSVANQAKPRLVVLRQCFAELANYS